MRGNQGAGFLTSILIGGWARGTQLIKEAGLAKLSGTDSLGADPRLGVEVGKATVDVFCTDCQHSHLDPEGKLVLSLWSRGIGL